MKNTQIVGFVGTIALIGIHSCSAFLRLPLANALLQLGNCKQIIHHQPKRIHALKRTFSFRISVFHIHILHKYNVLHRNGYQIQIECGCGIQKEGSFLTMNNKCGTSTLKWNWIELKVEVTMDTFERSCKSSTFLTHRPQVQLPRGADGWKDSEGSSRDDGKSPKSLPFWNFFNFLLPTFLSQICPEGSCTGSSMIEHMMESGEFKNKLVFWRIISDKMEDYIFSCFYSLVFLFFFLNSIYEICHFFTRLFFVKNLEPLNSSGASSHSSSSCAFAL